MACLLEVSESTEVINSSTLCQLCRKVKERFEETELRGNTIISTYWYDCKAL